MNTDQALEVALILVTILPFLGTIHFRAQRQFDRVLTDLRRLLEDLHHLDVRLARVETKADLESSRSAELREHPP